MTDDEAKTKWCPMVRAGENMAWKEVMDRTEETKRHPPQTNCIGSDCMMWRYSVTVDGAGFCGGYCGLAGKP